MFEVNLQGSTSRTTRSRKLHGARRPRADRGTTGARLVIVGLPRGRAKYAIGLERAPEKRKVSLTPLQQQPEQSPPGGRRALSKCIRSREANVCFNLKRSFFLQITTHTYAHTHKGEARQDRFGCTHAQVAIRHFPKIEKHLV